MGWVAIAGHRGGRFAANGLLPCAGQMTPDVAVGVEETRLMPRGTLLLETSLSPDGRPQTLLSFQRQHPWPGSFSLRALPCGGIVLVEAQGDDIRHATLPHNPAGRLDTVRLTYCWDALARWGQLTLERPESGAIHSITLPPPHPMMMAEIAAISTNPQPGDGSRCGFLCRVRHRRTSGPDADTDQPGADQHNHGGPRRRKFGAW